MPMMPSVIAAADRVRKCRERKRTGKVLATIEVDEMVLGLLASGTSTKPEVLCHDRARLNRAAERALRHFARMFAKTGEIPGLKTAPHRRLRRQRHRKRRTLIGGARAVARYQVAHPVSASRSKAAFVLRPCHAAEVPEPDSPASNPSTRSPVLGTSGLRQSAG